MNTKTSELTGAALDWAVAKCEGVDAPSFTNMHQCDHFHFSTNWAEGGLIIEREKIAISYDAEWAYDPTNVAIDDEPDNGDRWYAEIRRDSHAFVGNYGPTPLIAAMRCYVASKLGDKVEVPDGLE